MEENMTMKDFDNDINNSFKKLNTGDIVQCVVVSVSETEVTVDLNYYTEGVIALEELSNDPSFSIKEDIKSGDTIDAYVLGEDEENGHILLSKKKACDIIAWDTLKEIYSEKKNIEVKISETTNGGVITYVEGIRGFIPASKLALTYVEDLTSYVGKTLTARIITLEPSNKKLVLSVKDIEKENKEADKAFKIANLHKGTVMSGTVESIMPYGVFVNIGDDISGLVHISQICEKHIKSPNEVLKVGQKVNVKIINVKDGKVSLSIKACEENSELDIPTEDEGPTSYTSEESATTSLSSLLDGLKLN